MQTRVVNHPLVAARLTTLRDENSGNEQFRAALKELTQMLVYEAMADAKVTEFEVTTPLKKTTGVRLASPPLLVPVLRAGLGMVDQAHAMIPEAQVGFVGLGRDERTHQPVPYLESLPEDLSNRSVFVLDPMLATGGSMTHVLDMLATRGATDISALCVVVSPEGVETLANHAIPVKLFTAALDEGLNEHKFIVPGLGDAGDRQFGPR